MKDLKYLQRRLSWRHPISRIMVYYKLGQLMLQLAADARTRAPVLRLVKILDPRYRLPADVLDGAIEDFPARWGEEPPPPPSIH